MKLKKLAFVALTIVLAACGSAEVASDKPTATEAPATTVTSQAPATMAPTTTIIPATTPTEFTPAIGAQNGGEPPSAMAKLAADFYRYDPLGPDLNCDSMQTEYDRIEAEEPGMFFETDAEVAYVLPPLVERAAQEGCPVL
jgi:hypothetical protein